MPNPEIQQFITECKQVKLTEAEINTAPKKGIATGLTAIHPITNEELPIWLANFVLLEYGTGSVMSVPAHDNRDYEFATAYNLPIKPVIKPTTGDLDISTQAYTDTGILINSQQFDNLDYPTKPRWPLDEEAPFLKGAGITL